jgi:hypothetical protein
MLAILGFAAVEPRVLTSVDGSRTADWRLE